MLQAANPGHPPTPSGRRSPNLPLLRLLALALLLAFQLALLRPLALVTLVLLAWPR